MLDTQDGAHARELRRTAGTSTGTWAIVLGIAVALLALRTPVFIAVAEAALAQQADALDDPALAATAVAVGALGAVGMHALVLGLAAVIAAVLERSLGPVAIGGRLRVGVGGLTFAAIVLGLQAAATVLGVAALERSWPMWTAAAAVALVAPAAFAGARSTASAYARALLASCGTAVLLCAG